MTNKQSNSSLYTLTENDNFDLKRYLSLFFNNWYWFAVALFISLSIAYGINRWSEKYYTVSSSMLIRDDQFGGLNPGVANIFPGSEDFGNQQNLKNEIGILKSFMLNYKTLQSLKDFHVEYIEVGKRGIAEQRLYNKAPFKVVYGSLGDQVLWKKLYIRVKSETTYEIRIDGDNGNYYTYSFGERFNEKGFDFIIIPRDGGDSIIYNPDQSNKYYFYFQSPESLAQTYRQKLIVTPIEEDASLVTLTTSGYIPEQEADYLNTLMNIYREYGLDLKNETADQTLEFIEKQISSVFNTLDSAERALENFRLRNKLIDISREGQIIQNKLELADAEKSRLLLQNNYYNYLQEYIDTKRESGDIVAPSVMGINDQLLIDLVADLSHFQQQKKQLSLNLYETSGPLKTLDYNIIQTRNAISENIRNGSANLENSLRVLDDNIQKIESDIVKLPSTEREMITIQRLFDVNNTVYTFLLEKRAEAGIAKASNVPDNRIIDYAGRFSTLMIRPRERKNYITAFLLGLFFPILGIFLIDFLNNKIIDKKDIEKGTRASILGYINHNDLTSEIPVLEKPQSAMAESFRSVRTNLKYFLKDNLNPVIAVSSTITAEGKTFVSANLAAIIAAMEKKVLLVGLDLRKPRTHKILGVDNTTGISRYLIGEERIDDIIIKTNVPNLWYAPSGPVPPNPAELIDSAKMKEFIVTAKEKFDFIIIDTPPVAIVTDALLLSELTDIYIFVIRQRYSSKNTLDLIEELYQNENIGNICLILNDISLTGSYGYGLRYGYTSGYGYSYGYNYYGEYINKKYGYTDEESGYYKDHV